MAPMAVEAPTRPGPKRRNAVGTRLIALFGVVLTAAGWLNVEQEVAKDRAAEHERIPRENDALARAFEEHVRRVLQTADNALLFRKHELETHGG